MSWTAWLSGVRQALRPAQVDEGTRPPQRPGRSAPAGLPWQRPVPAVPACAAPITQPPFQGCRHGGEYTVAMKPRNSGGVYYTSAAQFSLARGEIHPALMRAAGGEELELEYQDDWDLVCG